MSTTVVTSLSPLWPRLLNFAVDRILSKFRGKSIEDVVAERLQMLLDSHDIKGIQFLDMVPSSWGLKASAVMNLPELAQSLDGERIGWLCNAFNVKKDWLMGVEDASCSMPLHGYKNLSSLGRSLAERGWLNSRLKMTILSKDYEKGSHRLGRYLIVFSTPATSDRRSHYKHSLFEAAWDSYHPPCMWDTKAVARWFSMHLHNLGYIPIVPITGKEFEQLSEGRLLPARFVPAGPGGFDRFEDRVLLSSESVLAREPDRVVIEVMEHLVDSGLLQATSIPA